MRPQVRLGNLLFTTQQSNTSILATDAQPGQQHSSESRDGTTRADAMACLELQCNQTFLGMVQLQYQPVVDIVQLIDLLEKACIRFVHFSKENELRYLYTSTEFCKIICRVLWCI